MIKGNLYILGAGGLAREIYSYLKESNYIYDGYTFSGFLDDNVNALMEYNYSHKIVDELFTSKLNDNDVVIIGVASPNIKEKLFEYYKDESCSIITFYHTSSKVGLNSTVGIGSVIGPYSVITSDVKVGNCCTINALSTIGHDASLGDYCTLSGHCDVTGFVSLGNKVFMGSSAAIIPSKRISDNVIIGAGSVVISNLKSGITVFGNPAKKIR
ncbi:transferase [Photobacterium kishitanii]|nr:transferase [Photobacterium kishitanii]PSV05528.1 transferase [Photobacterium kishitanii]PSV72608.1 transferase [Photobacterium kishitanii]